MPEPSDDARSGAAPAAPPTDMTEPVPTDEERAAAQKEVDDEVRRGRVELLAAVLLGLAGALTAFSAYKAALTDGDALAGYTMSSKSTSDANSFYDDYSQTYLSDQQMFLEFNLAAVEDPELAAEIRERFFSPSLEAATQV